MTPFSDGSFTEIPYPPPDVPTPNLPGANFADIGEQVAAGQAKAQPAGWPWRQLLDLLAEFIARVLTALLNCWLSVTTFILKLVFQFFQRSDANMDQLVASAVQGMLGLGPGKGTAGGGESAGAREGYAANIANMIQGSLEQNIAKNAQGGLAPSNAAANKFLALSAHIAIEGWTQGLMVEIGSAKYLERFADLKDTLENCLGMGRLARRALAAPIKILVEEPYTQLLNQTYQSTLLSPGELVREYLRDTTQQAKYYQQMALHGYNSDRAESIINSNKTHLSPATLEMLVESGSIPDSSAISRLNDQGYDNVDANALLLATRYEKQLGLRFDLAKEYIAAMAKGYVTAQWVTDNINSLHLPDYMQGYLEQLQSLRVIQLNTPKTPEPQRASLAQGEAMLKRGIWTLPQYEQLLNYNNYIPSDEFDLAQLASEEAIDWNTLQAQKAAALAARQQKEADRLRKAQMMVEDIGVSTGAMETMVYEGLRTIGQYQQYLLNKSVAPDNVQALSQALIIKLAQKTAAAAAKAAAQNKAKTKGVDLTQLETAVKQGIMDIPTFTQRVESLGMSSADAGLIAQELTNSISSAAAKTKAAAAAKATGAAKGIDLSQEERAVRLGILQMSDYQAFLIAKGFDAEQQGVLMMELQDQLTTDQQTAAKKKAAATKAATKGINLPQLERLVRAGVKTPADYTAALQAAGYDAADVNSLDQYLQLQMQQDQQDLVLKGHASALLDQMGVSLTDLERAVKLGVVPIATYQDALQRAGVSSDDEKTLVANLGAEIKTTRAQQATTATVSKQVAAAGVSLATLEKDTVSGKLSIQQFQGLLNGYNVPADQVTDTVALVQDEIDNKAAVDALVAGATAKAKAKGLDLAQITAAYKQQVITEDEWRADVAGLGYDAADVEILFETLAATQAAAAAKSATKSTGTAATAAAAGNGTATTGTGTTTTPTA